MTWTYEESEYQFKLPTIVGNLHSLNKTFTYDATCLEIYSKHLSMITFIIILKDIPFLSKKKLLLKI